MRTARLLDGGHRPRLLAVLLGTLLQRQATPSDRSSGMNALNLCTLRWIHQQRAHG